MPLTGEKSFFKLHGKVKCSLQIELKMNFSKVKFKTH